MAIEAVGSLEFLLAFDTQEKPNWPLSWHDQILGSHAAILSHLR